MTDEEKVAKTTTHSPTPLPKRPAIEGRSEEMDFYKALKVVADGGKVTKVEWENKDIFLKMKNEKLMIKTDDDMFHPLTVSSADIAGDDWVQIE
ncbi:MAG: Thoeris anti-defense Tad2 family protein [Planctomycetota bacterium]|jgi:hypothetical protein